MDAVLILLRSGLIFALLFNAKRLPRFNEHCASLYSVTECSETLLDNKQSHLWDTKGY